MIEREARIKAFIERNPVFMNKSTYEVGLQFYACPKKFLNPTKDLELKNLDALVDYYNKDRESKLIGDGSIIEKISTFLQSINFVFDGYSYTDNSIVVRSLYTDPANLEDKAHSLNKLFFIKRDLMVGVAVDKLNLFVRFAMKDKTN